MDAVAAWSVVHLLLIVAWFGAGVTAALAGRSIKNAVLPFPERRRGVTAFNRSRSAAHACAALTLPVGLALTGVVGVYPVNPGLNVAALVLAGIWFTVIVVADRKAGTPAAKLLGYFEHFLSVITGMALVVYGLNSLATGAPIDDPWFAAKVFLFGLMFWAALAVDLNFHSLFGPFEEIAAEDSTPEREEAVARAVDTALMAAAVQGALLVVIIILSVINPT